MLTLTQAFKDAQSGQDRLYKEIATVRLANNRTLNLTNSDFWSDGFRLEDAVSNHNSFDVGAVIMNQLTLTLNNIDGRFDDIDFRNAYIDAKIGIYGIEDQVTLGRYYVLESPKYSSGIITLTAYDQINRLAKTFDATAANITFPVALRVLVKKCLEVCSVSYQQSNIDSYIANYTVQSDFTGNSSEITYRQVIGWACQISCCYARMTRKNVVNNKPVLFFDWYDRGRLESAMTSDENLNLVHVIDSAFSPTINVNDTQITGTSVTESARDNDGNDITVRATAGTSGYIVSIEDNPLVQNNRAQSIANNLNAYLNGFSFRIASISCIPDISVEAGDVAVYIDRKGNKFPIIVSSVTFTGQGNMRIESSAAEQDGTQFAQYTESTKKYDTLAAMIKDEVQSRKSGETTIMNNISANYVTTQALNSTNANIGTLNTDLVNFQEAVGREFTSDRGRIGDLETTRLKASDAVITNLQSAFANIATILSGTIGTGQLQTITLNSQNATFDRALIRNVLASEMYVNDLKAGDIDTNKFTVKANDGSLIIEGSTLTFKDANDVTRIQIGKDANDDFTFILYDSTGNGVLIDESGIKASSVDDGLIVNRMIASKATGYDGLTADKLDISSVVGAINTEGGLKSTTIRFDAQNQTLDQIYTSLQQGITRVSSIANNAASNASIANTNSQNAVDAAQQALNTLSGISTLDAFSATLTNDVQIIRTLTDGSGADYTNCSTQINAFLGDTNISAQCAYTYAVSSGITGTWINDSHSYFVSGMSTDEGYVDITAIYHQNQSDETSITKRFSIVKVKDGGVGISYSLILNAQIFKVNIAKTIMTPDVISGNAYYNDGSTPKNYNGIFEVYTTLNNSTYTLYQKTVVASNTFSFTIPKQVVGLKVNLLSADGLNLLDTAYASIVTDPEELKSTLTDTANAAYTNTQAITRISNSVGDINSSISTITDRINGISDGNLIYQTPYTANGDIVTIRAVVYKDGQDVTTQFPSTCFTWAKRIENGEVAIGSGYSIQVDRSDYGYGGTVIGRFDTPTQTTPTQTEGEQSNE